MSLKTSNSSDTNNTLINMSAIKPSSLPVGQSYNSSDKPMPLCLDEASVTAASDALKQTKLTPPSPTPPSPLLPRLPLPYSLLLPCPLVSSSLSLFSSSPSPKFPPPLPLSLPLPILGLLPFPSVSSSLFSQPPTPSLSLLPLPTVASPTSPR